MSTYLQSALKEFRYYKMLGEKTIDQLTDEDLRWQYNSQSNSVAIIVKHLWGNMLSRWSDFLTSDGEKLSRNREGEFENDIIERAGLVEKWNEGWNCLLTNISALTEEDLLTTVYIRGEPHTVLQAINRQIAHYAYHVGQIVFIGKMLKDANWQSLSIPRGGTQKFNDEMFSKKNV